MSVVVLPWSAGLIGSEASRRFAGAGPYVVGLDNDKRRFVLLLGLWRARQQETSYIGHVFCTCASVVLVGDALFVSTWPAPALCSFLATALVAHLGFAAPPETPRGAPA